MKVARNEKRKKLLGFSFYINIGNFEAFLWNLNLSAKHLFWTCADSDNLGHNHLFHRRQISISRISLPTK